MLQAILLFILALAGTACSNSPAPPSSAPAASSSDAPATARVSGRTASGALVTLEPGGGAPMPEGSAVLDQFSKAFVPETLFVRVGQPVIFKNSEDQLHNVTVVRSRTGTGVLNISQNQGDVHTHTFDQPGEYDVSCDVHPGMRGVIVATTTPYAMYADPGGAFSFTGIPPGQYTLRVSGDGRVASRTVDVKGTSVDLGDVRPGSGG